MQAQHLTFKPSSVVAERIHALGRTEDVVFSPDQTRLAIAGFISNRILIIQIRIVTENGTMSVQSDGCVELCCSDFNCPHGISWIDDSTMVIANRGKDVVIVSVPDVSDAGEVVEVDPLLRLSQGSHDTIAWPGSVAVIRLTEEYFDVLVCNNYRNYVSRHIIHRRNGFEIIAGHRLFGHGLKVPDSVAVTTDGELVAVSNHHAKRIDVFRNDASSAPYKPPAFSLGGIRYPHGVRFAMDDRLVLAADAAAPHVHVYVRDGVSWESASGPVVSIRVMDDESFRRGQTNPEEGGPKGVDVLKDGSLFAVSCEEMPIAFFDFRSVRDQFVGPETTDPRQARSYEARMLETALAAMKGQQDQIATQRAELAKLKAIRDRSLDRRLLRLLRRLALKATGSARKH